MKVKCKNVYLQNPKGSIKVYDYSSNKSYVLTNLQRGHDILAISANENEKKIVVASSKTGSFNPGFLIIDIDSNRSRPYFYADPFEDFARKLSHKDKYIMFLHGNLLFFDPSIFKFFAKIDRSSFKAINFNQNNTFIDIKAMCTNDKTIYLGVIPKSTKIKDGDAKDKNIRGEYYIIGSTGPTDCLGIWTLNSMKKGKRKKNNCSIL